VRLLDFGVATARFDRREAVTTSGLAGTPGYLAPERLEGVDGPAGDVYSLGVVLWVLATGERAGQRPPAEIEADEVLEAADGDADLAAVLALAATLVGAISARGPRPPSPDRSASRSAPEPGAPPRVGPARR
ncbi:MAG: hypothetical protein KC621_08950, partial [Myxococcales bacterium]|nr:hypothetical protein [Myxococcales bacterium]